MCIFDTKRKIKQLQLNENVNKLLEAEIAIITVYKLFILFLKRLLKPLIV